MARLQIDEQTMKLDKVWYCLGCYFNGIREVELASELAGNVERLTTIYECYRTRTGPAKRVYLGFRPSPISVGVNRLASLRKIRRKTIFPTRVGVNRFFYVSRW